MTEQLISEGHPLWRANAIDLVPSRTGNKLTVEVRAVDGPVLAVEDGGTVTDPAGEEVGALESRDRKGRELAFVTPGGADAGVMRVTDEESGLLARLKTHRRRTYRVELTGPVDEGPRGLMLATAIRYEAVLAAIKGESMD